MSRVHKKFMKKKEREKRVRRQVLLHREAVRTQAKEAERWELEEQKSQPKREPIKNPVTKEQARVIKKKIKRNNEILAFLEEEGAKEIKVSDISISEMAKK
jgi:hypothetical protein